MRIMAIDPGEKRIGIAISDLSGTIANPLVILSHVSRAVNAATIASLAEENNAAKIIVGQALDVDGNPTRQGRRASRLAQTIRSQTQIPVELWDETGSTQAARAASIAQGVSSYKRRRKSRGHLDDLAATYILQTYLDYTQNWGRIGTEEDINS